MLAGGNGMGEVDHEGETLIVFYHSGYDRMDPRCSAPRVLLAQIVLRHVTMIIIIAIAFVLSIMFVMSWLIGVPGSLGRWSSWRGWWRR